MTYSLDFTELSTRYRSGVLTPSDVVRDVFTRIKDRGADNVWTYLLPVSDVIESAKALEKRWHARGAEDNELPLYGMIFGVKDNIDVAGLPTTNACPAYKYTAKTTATVVQRLLDAGALLIGKTNLDQFANGLVGVRSSYGIARNAINSKYIPGGSSPGSAVAVAAGLVSFALGTDTGGSGRVPAAYNNVVGLKPTRGLLSTTGLIPVNRGVDCPSVFALTCDDAHAVLNVARGYDPTDPFSHHGDCDLSPPPRKAFRFGVPAGSALTFFGDAESERMFKKSVETLTKLGGTPIEIDFAPFKEAGSLLFGGAWVAERLTPARELFESDPGAFHPVTRAIFERATKLSATEAFESIYRLAQLRQRAAMEWEKMDILVVPTTGTLYTIDAVEADPIQLNTNMGYYTYFVNMLLLCAIAVPAGLRKDGMPSSISLIAPSLKDGMIRNIATKFHRRTGLKMGATDFPIP